MYEYATDLLNDLQHDFNHLAGLLIYIYIYILFKKNLFIVFRTKIYFFITEM